MESKCYRKELIGLFGCPVDENPTVVTIEAAFHALGLNYRYNPLLVYPEDLEDAVKGLRAFHMKGTHITIPHKVNIIKYLDGISENAALIGAVNTVYERDGKLLGENTDGKGFLISLQEGNVELKDKNAYILGAGGAARAIAVELAVAGAKKITIANRSRERGQELVDLINQKTEAQAELILWDHTLEIPEDTDILVNATSIGLYPDTSRPDIRYDMLLSKMVVCDVISNPLHTGFTDAAEQAGCRVFGGFDMLVNQGAISFKLWTGMDAPVDVMKQALRAEFEN